MPVKSEPKPPDTCGQCRYYNPSTAEDKSKHKLGKPSYGQCRYYAPDAHYIPCFPQVASDDVGCGMGKPLE